MGFLVSNGLLAKLKILQTGNSAEHYSSIKGAGIALLNIQQLLLLCLHEKDQNTLIEQSLHN